jgi:ATP-dependent DNA helicase DinG
MQEVFGPEGLIARTHPEYEHRPGQIEMAAAVLRAFEEKRHLIVEAGTGTGKTLAYLVPAIAAACGSGARIVISTGTKNLQEQLMEKDIPFLQETLPAKFRAAVMKGRNNYACLHRIKRAESMPVLEGLEQIDQFDEVFRWSTTTETGDRAELSNLPENLPFWRHIDARSDTCLGQKVSGLTSRVSSRGCGRGLWMPTSSSSIIICSSPIWLCGMARMARCCLIMRR